jgi:signal transduction histidine kinase
LRLAIARRLAAGNGGDLTVDSRREIGVLFTLTMPVAPATA